MDNNRFEEIKTKIEKAKNDKARAEGVQQSILARWKTDFGINSQVEAQTKVEELRTSITRDEARLGELMTKLEGAADWDSI